MDPLEPMKPLERLMAIEAIKQTKARYFRTLDAKDWEGFSAIFTPDAQMDMRAELQHHAHEPAHVLLRDGDPVLVGPDRITTFVSDALPPSVITVHQGHMPEIEVTGPDTASGTWAMFDYLDDGGTGMRGFGHYHEEYRRVDGAWLIHRLELRRIRVDPF